MDERLINQLIADGLLIVHGLFVAFVVFGLAVVGSWVVHPPRFRRSGAPGRER